MNTTDIPPVPEQNRMRDEMNQRIAESRMVTGKPSITTSPVTCPHCHRETWSEWWMAGYHEYADTCRACGQMFLVKIRLSGHVIPAQEITQERIFD